MRLTADGELLGEFSQSNSNNQLEYYNFANSTITQCNHDPKTDVLTCRAFLIGSEDDLWETTIPNIAHFNPYSSAIMDGYLFLFGEDNSLVKYAIGQP
jgi:hypothetical protein